MIEPLYHQTICGRKTMTRRSGGLDAVNYRVFNLTGKGEQKEYAADWFELVRYNNDHAKFFERSNALNEVYCKPRYKINEVLYIKEPYLFLNPPGIYKYRYSKELSYVPTECFKNKLFMPAVAGREFVRITGIKCERLMDISDEDCLAEGIDTGPTKLQHLNLTYKNYKSDNEWFVTPKESFISLYKFANKVKDVPNLWVWAYTFEYLKNYKP